MSNSSDNLKAAQLMSEINKPLESQEKRSNEAWPQIPELFPRRYIFTFEVKHCPSRAKAKLEVPADSQFEAEAILTRLLGEPKLSLPDYWTLVGETTRFDTALRKFQPSKDKVHS